MFKKSGKNDTANFFVGLLLRCSCIRLEDLLLKPPTSCGQRRSQYILYKSAPWKRKPLFRRAMRIQGSFPCAQSYAASNFRRTGCASVGVADRTSAPLADGSFLSSFLNTFLKETNEYMIWWELTQPVSFFVCRLSFLFQSSLFSLPKHTLYNEREGRVIDEKI